MQRKFESIVNKFSIIAVVLAVINYKRRASEYAKYVDDEDTVLVKLAMNTYAAQQAALRKQYENQTNFQGDNNRPLSGVSVSYILRVGMLVGKKMTIQPTLVLTNITQDKQYILSDFKAGFYIQNRSLNYTFENNNQSVLLNAGQTVTVQLEGLKNKQLLPEDAMDDLRSLICSKNGKKLITSCPKTTIENATRGRVEFQYTGKKSAGATTRAMYDDVIGVLRYCGEAYYL